MTAGKSIDSRINLQRLKMLEILETEYITYIWFTYIKKKLGNMSKKQEITFRKDREELKNNPREFLEIKNIVVPQTEKKRDKDRKNTKKKMQKTVVWLNTCLTRFFKKRYKEMVYTSKANFLM